MLSTHRRDPMQSLIDELSKLKDREACATTATEQRRWQVLVLLASGKSRQEISAATGYSLRTIRQIMQRYRTSGSAGLVDGRRRLAMSTLLTEAQLQALRTALHHPPAGGGLWTGPKVARWMSLVTGKPIHRQRGWEYLQRLGAGEVGVTNSAARTGKGDGTAKRTSRNWERPGREVKVGSDSR